MALPRTSPLRWIDPIAASTVADTWRPSEVRAALAWVVGDAPEENEDAVPLRRVAQLLASLPVRGEARIVALAEVSRQLSRQLPAQQARVGLPPRVWEALLRRRGHGPPTSERCWVGARQREGFAPDGARCDGATEWWADARRPGASYAERLWAWGTLEGEALPRAAWQVVDGAFAPTRALSGLAEALDDPPRITAGPGLLVACLLDAVWTLTRGASLTHRDAAALWGGFFLPVLAPAHVISVPPHEPRAVPPDYAVQLAFHLLHPRAQVALRLLDRVATWVDAGDEAAVHAATGVAEGDALTELLGRVARSALARDAAERWDSGLGFRLLRRILRALQDAPDAAGAIDAALHGAPGDPSPIGPLAERLREAFGTALTQVDRRAPGAATSQLVDLVLLRWSDPSFL